MAGLGEAGRPFEDTGVEVERCARGHVGAGVLHGLAIEVGGIELDADRIALAHRARRHAVELWRRVAGQHRDLDRGLGSEPAIAGQDAQVVINARCGVAGQPVDRAANGVEHHAGRQLVGRQAHGLAIGVKGVERHVQQLAFAQRVRRLQAGQGGRAVAASHVDAEGLGGRRTAGVIDPQHHASGGGDAGGGRPGQQAGAGVQRHAVGAIHQQVAQADAVGVDGLDLVAVGLADGGLGDCGALDQRRQVGVGQRVDASAQVSALAGGRHQRDGLQQRGLAGLQAGAGAGQIQQPQAAHGVDAHRTTAEEPRRVEHQPQGRQQVELGNVGDAQVVRHRAAAAVGACVDELDAHVG